VLAENLPIVVAGGGLEVAGGQPCFGVLVEVGALPAGVVGGRQRPASISRRTQVR
jgi:hypothetical protein